MPEKKKMAARKKEVFPGLAKKRSLSKMPAKASPGLGKPRRLGEKGRKNLGTENVRFCIVLSLCEPEKKVVTCEKAWKTLYRPMPTVEQSPPFQEHDEKE